MPLKKLVMKVIRLKPKQPLWQALVPEMNGRNGRVGFPMRRRKENSDDAKLCVTQGPRENVGRGNMGWAGVGGGFLDFCCRKKPAVRGRADRGRVR